MNNFDEKIERFAEMVENQTKERYLQQGYTVCVEHGNHKTSIKPGKKYTKVDVYTSGKYMVVNETGEIFGIKAYGVIHRGHYYGTLDEIEDWYWGDYTAYPKN